jgi:hypothetical protein
MIPSVKSPILESPFAAGVRTIEPAHHAILRASRTTATGRWWLLFLVLAAFELRIAAVLVLRSYLLPDVTYEHGEIARNLLDGRGFSVCWLGAEGATSTQAPVFPLVVAAAYWLCGGPGHLAVFVLQSMQAVVGAGLVAAVVALARQLFPDRSAVAWWSGAGAAVYPTLVYCTTHVQPALLLALFTMLTLWSALRARSSGSCRWGAACGLCGGLLVLTDPILSLVVVVAFTVLVPWRPQRGRLGAWARPLGTALAVCTMLLAPWLVRNYRVHGELVFVKSTFGYAFWQGNNPHSWGTDKLPKAKAYAMLAAAASGARGLDSAMWQARHETVYIDDALLSPAELNELGRLSEPDRSRVLFRRAADYIAGHPMHYLRLCLQRLRYFLLFDETNPKTHVLPYRLAHGGLLLLSLAGLWTTRGQWRQLWPTYAAFGGVTLFHAATIVSARFHIPLEPMQLIWAAAAVELARHALASGGQTGRNWQLVFATIGHGT